MHGAAACGCRAAVVPRATGFALWPARTMAGGDSLRRRLDRYCSLDTRCRSRSREEAAPPHVTATAPWPITFHVNYWPLHVVSATAVAVVTFEHGALQQERVDALKRRVSDNVTSQLGTEVHCPCGWHFRCEDNLHDIWLHHGQKQCTAEGIHLYALLSYKGRKHVLHALQS